MLHAPETDLFSLNFHFSFFFYFETPNRLEKRKKTHVKYDQYQCMIYQVVTKFCDPGISLD